MKTAADIRKLLSEEDTILDQVTLTLKMITADTDEGQKDIQSANGTHSDTYFGTHSGTHPKDGE